MVEVTFDSLITQLIYRAGDETGTVDPAASVDYRYLLNFRLQECYRYASWDFLKQVATVTFDSAATARSIDLTDGRQVLGIFIKDPREMANGHLSSIAARVVEGGKLWLPKGTPDTVYIQFIPAAPDWISTTPTPTVIQELAAPAVELTYSDKLEQDGQPDKATFPRNRGYNLLSDLASRRSRMNTLPRTVVQTSQPSMTY